MSAWAEIEGTIAGSGRPVHVRPALRADETLRRLGVRAESPLGAVATESGGILVDDGWLRIPGGGSAGFPSIAEWPGEGADDATMSMNSL